MEKPVRQRCGPRMLKIILSTQILGGEPETSKTPARYMCTFVYAAHRSHRSNPEQFKEAGVKWTDEEELNEHRYCCLCIVNLLKHTSPVCHMVPGGTKHLSTWSSASNRSLWTGPLSLSLLKRTPRWVCNMTVVRLTFCLTLTHIPLSKHSCVLILI